MNDNQTVKWILEELADNKAALIALYNVLEKSGVEINEALYKEEKKKALELVKEVFIEKFE